ncbi:penicillin acylase family protein [Ovoidimarina sediminis]|uniref:penicillin acylase family protein n=1 Tax=Ovoidimarina sediminis TaxID=3079856 RepID=UPI002912BC58|nr:penicillin acylase family protein [Rhodophyticola sp. MJ-SS7]MDU8941939.1 penicillin acylase family protein [Rhodophyticola sp. MJ-SS7]
MARVFRWLLRFVTAVIVLALSTVMLLYWFASRSIPDYTATHEVWGLGGPIEIVRDNANVPHVFAESDADVYYGLGFAHAQDRLWQMMTLRRTAQGRLSEIFGARTFRVDDLMRRLDLYTLAVQSVAAQDEYTRAALEAYAAGVNAWLGAVNEGARGRGAPEFWLFPPQIAPWQPADSIAVTQLMALRLTDSAQDEVLRARVSLLLDEARLSDILPDAPGTGVAALPDYAALVPGAGTRFAALAPPAAYDPLDPVSPRGMAGASNAWAASPARSASGGTLLANDPHLGFDAPGIWYLARLELQSGGVIGGTIPGIPAVLVGRNDDIAWGLTTTNVDDQDIVIERLNPENPEEVMAPGGWERMRTRSSIIQVKDGEPQTVTLRWSANGPILPGHHYDLATITPEGHVAALAWTALTGRNSSVTAAMGIMRAETVEEALAAGEAHVAPAQNLTVADRSRIAMKVVGALPRRSVRHQSRGRLPTPGWREQNLWQGVMSYGGNPEFLDPDGGILGNTNNKIIDRPFPFHVTYDWGDTQRVERWRGLMQSREVHTRDSFVEAQLDTVSFSARALLPLVGRDLFFTGDPAPEGTPERRRQDALTLLANWNGEMNEHLPEPLIYAAWMRALQDRLIRDELGGTLAAEFTHVEPLFIERVFRDVEGASVWCDVLRSSETETCVEIARQALDDALIWIAEQYGDDLASLRWGDAHEAVHAHPVLGTTAGLDWVVNIRQSTSGGDNTLLRGLTAGTGDAPFRNVHGAGYRGVYDLADPDSSVFIIATGQSGHPLSRHYDDLGELWRRGEYIPMSLEETLARAAAVGVTRLVPHRGNRQP